tara:strand:- start:733 stop:1362 length:630 start_codon:yes stop_codon:yes gene_type:complete
MKLIARSLPNIGTIEAMLSDDIIKDIWKLIEEAKQNPVDMRKELAGNINSSLSLNLNSPITNKFIKEVLTQFIESHMNAYGETYRLQINENQSLNINKFWVNFQRQTEFNPAHIHDGIYSFVIWMKIPTSWEEQSKLPIAVESNVSTCISNFLFTYTDTLGNIRTFNHIMNKEKEGMMVLFPASLHHQVYPFYNCDEERISISGNIVIE